MSKARVTGFGLSIDGFSVALSFGPGAITQQFGE
jgi:hypothetical protein